MLKRKKIHRYAQRYPDACVGLVDWNCIAPQLQFRQILQYLLR